MRKLPYILACMLISLSTSVMGNKYEKIIDLSGKWSFMIGDDMQRALTEYKDTDWEQLMVPSKWENQGFHGYDGYAWYRKKVVISSNYKDASLTLFLGYIDDVDETYFNGVRIGRKGSFPPNLSTAYSTERRYNIPPELIRYDKANVIAVRVYDSMMDGGIINGTVGLYTRHRDFAPDIDLEGEWKFKTGDNLAWAESKLADDDWESIPVPGYWEDNFAGDYDGFAWYRKDFTVAKQAAGKRYVLSLGKIDDIDEVYINGKCVASTGKINSRSYQMQMDGSYNKERYYYLNEEDLIPGRVNTIAVRVYDAGGGGGIYSGSIGLYELKRFVSHWRKK